jgi:LPS export ABC transporter protein LptC
MSWRWVSVTALLAAVVLSYGVLTGGPRDTDVSPGVERTPPGYYLKDAVITDTTERGTPSVRLAARRIEQQPADGSIDLDDVHVEYLAVPERHWMLTADTGHVPAGSSTIEFAGNVTLESKDQPQSAVVTTDDLAIDTATSVATTDAAVSIELSGHRVLARGLRADLEHDRVELESDVSGRFARQPQP